MAGTKWWRGGGGGGGDGSGGGGANTDPNGSCSGGEAGSFGSTPYTDYPAVIAADCLHDVGIDGAGVTLAVLDTGLWKKTCLQDNPRHGLLACASHVLPGAIGPAPLRAEPCPGG